MWTARRTLFHEHTHMVLSVVGFGLSVMHMIVLRGVLRGVQQQVADYLTHVPGSVVVASSETGNFVMVALPLGSRDEFLASPERFTSVTHGPGARRTAP